MARGSGLGLHRFALATAAATWVLLVAGALVTSTGSGDAVPDWWFVPISFGTLLPEMTGGVLFEHGHRLVAATVGLGTAVLAIWIQRVEARRFVRALAWVAFAAVVVQGTLGGLRVLRFHPTVSAIVHATLGQAFFAATVSLAVLTSKSWNALAPRGTPSPLPRLATATTAFVLAAVFLGAILRHTGEGLVLHVGTAVLAAGFAVGTSGTALGRHAEERALAGPAVALLGLVAAQALLGLGAFGVVGGGAVRSLDLPVASLALVTGHLAVGALVLAASLVLALRARRLLGSPAPSPQPLPSGATA